MRKRVRCVKHSPVMSLDPKTGLWALQKSSFFEITRFESRDESLKDLRQAVKRSKVSLLVLCNNLDSSYVEQPLDTERKLNVHKTFRRRPERLLNILCTFNLCHVSKGNISHSKVYQRIVAKIIKFPIS